VTLGFLISGLAVLTCGGWALFTGSRLLLSLLSRREANDGAVVRPVDFSGEKNA
jgi:hypothetical protein